MRSSLLRALLALSSAAALVLLGVMGLAAVVLPEPPPATDFRPTAATAATAVREQSAAPQTPPPPELDPTHPGGSVQVSGDREANISFESSQTAFSEDSLFTLDSAGESLRLGNDEEVGLFVEQATLDGLNFFLDPGDCTFEEQEMSEATGIATLDLSCPEISDVQGKNTVSVDGYVYVPLLLAAEDAYAPGGTITITGDVEERFEVNDALWYVVLETDSADHSVTETANNLYAFGDDDEGPRGVEFAVTESGPILYLLHLGRGDSITLEDECPATVEELARIGPETEYLEMTVSCVDVGDADRRISIEATLRVHRVTDMVTYFSN